MWTAGPAPIDLDATWPPRIVRTIVASFSEPGGRVVLLPWPTSQPTPGDGPRLAPVGADGVIDRASGTEPDAELADALAAVEGLDRTGRVVRVAADPTATGPGSRPFWADLLGGPDRSPATVSEPPLRAVGGVEETPTNTDLIITSLRPEHGGDHASDLVALLAARLLRVGGILAVLTHCDWTRGELIDPTGAVVASAQNADLLYLQHVAALHTPVRGVRFTAVPGGPATEDEEGEDESRSRHRAAVRGLAAPHRRIHSDVLVFASSTHQSPRPGPAGAAFETGVIR